MISGGSLFARAADSIPMGYQLILWDFDGTLVDTFASLVGIYNDLAARHGIRPVTDPEAVRGLTPLEFLKKQNIPWRLVPSLAQEVRVAQASQMAGTRLIPGLVPVLEALRRAGGRMGVLSSNASANIQSCLRANGVEDGFDFILGYSRLLGKARGIRRLLKDRALDPRAVVYVGDEVRDLEAARQAGVAFAAVTWGFNSRELLAQRQPDYLVDRPEELRQLLE